MGLTPQIIVTRPAVQGAAFAQMLGLPVILCPLIKIVSIAVTDDLSDAAHVIFTSVNGVAQAERLGVPVTAQAWCVGTKTAQAAKAAGFGVHDAGGDSADLIALMMGQNLIGRMVHISGQHVQVDVAANLSQAGVPCQRIAAYDQIVLAPTDAALGVVQGQAPIILPLFSVRTAQAAATLRPIAAPLHVVTMSESIARAAAPLAPVSVTTVKTPDNSAMITSVLTLYEALLPPRVS